MKMTLVFLLPSLFYATASAQSQFSLQPQDRNHAAPAALLGTWGSAEQCAAHRAGGNANPGLFPYLITRDWIERGGIYCLLSWQHDVTADDGIEAHAGAQCGEDDIREYRLALKLAAGKLRIRWSDDFTTGELEFCGQEAGD